MLIIERFEGGFAVVEQDGNGYLHIPRSKLPLNAREGDCLILENNRYRVDTETTRKRREKILELQNKLWE